MRVDKPCGLRQIDSRPLPGDGDHDSLAELVLHRHHVDRRGNHAYFDLTTKVVTLVGEYVGDDVREETTECEAKLDPNNQRCLAMDEELVARRGADWQPTLEWGLTK